MPAPSTDAQAPATAPPFPSEGEPGQAQGSPQANDPALSAPALRYPVSAASPVLALPRAIEAREEALARDLGALGARSEGRVLNGSLQLAAGVALVTVGAVLGDEIGRSLLILLGAGALSNGIVVLAVPDAAARANRYTHMPMLTADQVRARIRFGEESLARLARAGRRARIADGTVTMTVAAAYVPLLWWLERRADAQYRFGDTPYDYVAIALSGISFASGLVTALVKTEAERRYRGYREFDEFLEQQAPGALERLARRTSLDLAASSHQLAVRARVRF